jgi:hypothetical protein
VASGRGADPEIRLAVNDYVHAHILQLRARPFSHGDIQYYR